MVFSNFQFKKTSGLVCFTNLHTAAITSVQLKGRTIYGNINEEEMEYWNNQSSSMLFRRKLRYINNNTNASVDFYTGLELRNAETRFLIWFPDSVRKYTAEAARLKQKLPNQYDDNQSPTVFEFWVSLPDADFVDFCQGTPQGIQKTVGFLDHVLSVF
ncbi:MAG: hypothetical protein LBQ88_10520 [Treponema sp.]|jgi:hypothetical protein|nr:hypothetical protein [Treponema sp.]